MTRTTPGTNSTHSMDAFYRYGIVINNSILGHSSPVSCCGPRQGSIKRVIILSLILNATFPLRMPFGSVVDVVIAGIGLKCAFEACFYIYLSLRIGKVLFKLFWAVGTHAPCSWDKEFVPWPGNGGGYHRLNRSSIKPRVEREWPAGILQWPPI